MNETTLRQSLQNVRGRVRKICLGAGLGWALAVGLGLLILWMWVDLLVNLPPALRVSAIALTSLCGLSLIAWSLARAIHQGSPASLARQLDAAAGSQGQILSGVDLMATSLASAADSTTRALARLATERAAQLAARVSPAKAVSTRPLVRPYAGLLMASAAVLAVVIAAPRLASTQWSRFFDPYGDHPPYSRITLEVQPGNARVVYGASLDIHVSTGTEPAEKLEVVVVSGGAEEALPMFPEQGGKWEATLARVTAAGQYYVRARGAQSQKFNLEVITVPKLEQMRFRITPPAYTHRAPYEGPLPQGGLAGLPDTLVEMWARSNRPLASGAGQVTSAMVTPPAAIALQPTSPGADEVSGSFRISQSGKLELRLTDTAGQISSDAFTTPVTVLADQRPFVRLMEPKANSFATPDAVLDVQMIAEDNFGISRLQLFRSLNASRSRPTEIPVPDSQPTRLPAGLKIKLDDYGLSPGDTIELYARVEDNDPTGAKGSESSVVTVKVISREDLNRMLVAREGLEVLQSKYEQARRRLEATDERIDKLEKELAKLDADSELAREKLQELNRLAEQTQAEADQLARTAEDDLPFDLDHALKKELERSAQALQDAAKEASKMAGQKGLSASAARQGLGEMRKKLGTRHEELKEEANAPIEHLAKIFPLIEDQARYLDLYEKQKDLAQRMQSLQGQRVEDPKTKVRMRDLEAEQRQQREELSALLEEIENHLAQLPADERLDDLRNSARKFVDAVKPSGAVEQMASSESFLTEFKPSPAQSDAQQAADTMARFIAQCNGMGEQGGTCLKFQPKLSSAMGNTVEQLLAAEGLNTGKGNGTASGGGFSSRRSTLRNIGMYGGLPTRGPRAGAHKGGSADHGTSSQSGGVNPDADQDGGTGAAAKSRASGESDAVVPVRYRRQVGDYFQRVADELGEK